MKMKRLLMLFFVLLLVSCSSTRFNVIDEIIGNSIDERIFPGAVLLVGNSQDILYHKAYGTYTYAEDSKKTEKNSLFDLASLTKVFATSMCMMKCIDSGLVDPDAYVINYLPEFNNHGKQVIRIRDLLTHHSGMPAYASRTGSREKTLENIMNMPMTQELGEYKYSCLNFITLMRVCEAATGMPMWKFYKQIYTDPMELNNTMFNPPQDLVPHCLPTVGDSSGIHIVKQGIVHDPLAEDLEGFSGNAGLFSTAEDLSVFCRMLMRGGNWQDKEFVRAETLEKFTHPQNGHRAFGWGVNTVPCSAGSKMSEHAFGHTGYTGTSCWIDPDRDLFVILLTNRVYPLDQKAVTPVRKKIHDVVAAAWDEK